MHGRALVWACLNAHPPRCVVVGPPGTVVNRLMAICKGRMPLGRFGHTRHEGKARLSFARPVCKFQHAHGRYFFHEHLAEASSWTEAAVLATMSLHGAMIRSFDQLPLWPLSALRGGTDQAYNYRLAQHPGRPRGVRRSLLRLSHPPSTDNRLHAWHRSKPLFARVQPGSLQGNGPAGSA